MTDAPKLSAQLAAKLDAKADAGKVREDWRDFFKFTSTRWNVVTVANALGLAVPAYIATEKVGLSQAWPLWACFVTGVCAAIGVFYGVLTKQKNLQPDDPAQPKDDP